MQIRIIFAAIVVAFIASTTFAAEAKRPNVLVIVADDLGWNDLGYTGSTFYESPNIDALAARGCVFTSAYAACPVCSPTRAALMTGKYPPRVHITDYIGGPQPDKARTRPIYRDRLLPAPYEERLRLEETTIGEVFKSNGYNTFFAGKWHLGGDGFTPDHQGFDVSIGAGKWGSPGKDGYFSPYNVNLTPGPKGEHLDLRLANEAVKWLQQQHEDKPFLCWMSFYDVHVPLMAPPKTIEYFEEKKKRLNLEDKFVDEPHAHTRQTQSLPIYAAMVKTLDEAVGIVVDQLKAQHQLDNTIIVFTSDNGGLSTAEGSPTSNLPLRGGKGWSYEGGVRVPLLAVVPGVSKPNTKSNDPAITMDIFATLQSACGFANQNPQDGADLTPALKGDHLPVRNLFWHYPHYGNQGGSPFSSIRSGEYKLIAFHDPRQGEELYNLVADPGEQHNLAKENSAKVEELRALLNAWKKDVGAIDASKQN